MVMKQCLQAGTEALQGIMGVPENSIPVSLLKNAYGVAVNPGVVKAEFIASIGFQVGAQSTDVILEK
jgi:lipid-binding SYLF domain-containing protein